MANQASIQRHINRGYGKAAKRLGSVFVRYRPLSSTAVIVNNNIVNEQMLAFDRDHNFGLVAPQDYDVSRYYALTDLTNVQPGDYFTNYDLTFFVAWIEPIKPAELILCNRVIRAYRPATGNGYGGDTTPQLLLTGWPASILPGTKGEANVAGLPGSIRSPWLAIKLPKHPSFVINPFDLIIDDLDRRYIASDVSLAKEGYEISASYESS